MTANSIRQAPTLSIIIPTHNRRVSLQRVLDALCCQTYPLDRVEVLVVADGCTDDTTKMLRHYPAPFALRVIEKPGQGAAAARNQGAAQALAPLLLFLDDDVEPTPALIEAHLQAHQHQPGRVVIGPYPPVTPGPADLFTLQLRAWWEDKFNSLGRPGHRFTYRDLLSGNFSLTAELFHRVGGFDPTIHDCGGEDYEFGVRLIEAHVVFNFANNALAYHHIKETTDLNRIFQRARQEGRVDVIIGQRHPKLRSGLLVAKFQFFRLRYKILLPFVLFLCPAAANRLATVLQQALHPLERAGFRHYWQRLYGLLHVYWYWRGVADLLGHWRAVTNFAGPDQTFSSESSPLDLDLCQGFEIAEQQLDRARPMAARIFYGQQLVGLIPAHPGAEALRGVHLRPVLADELAVPFLEALALAGAVASAPAVDGSKLSKSIRSKSPWFGPTQINQMWYEQYSQWNHLEHEV